MRNPPSHLKLNEPTSRDAAYETEALIDHLFTHDNAAAFFCRRLLQRLTTSNPSPTYLGAVTTAFKEGKYDGCVQGNEGVLAQVRGHWGCYCDGSTASGSEIHNTRRGLDPRATEGAFINDLPLFKSFRVSTAGRPTVRIT